MAILEVILAVFMLLMLFTVVALVWKYTGLLNFLLKHDHPHGHDEGYELTTRQKRG